MILQSRSTRTFTITDAAADLARSIMDTPEYTAYKSLENRMKQSPGIKYGVDKLNAMTDELGQDHPAVDEAEVLKAYESFWENLDTNPVVDDFVEARNNLLHLFSEIREKLSQRLDVNVNQLICMSMLETDEAMDMDLLLNKD